MLSTQYRLRLEFICKCIANGEEVKLEDMIWAEKLSKANTTAREWLRKARRQAKGIEEGSTDDFLNRMGLGDPTHPIIERGLIVLMKSLIGSKEINPTTGGNVTEKQVPWWTLHEVADELNATLRHITCVDSNGRRYKRVVLEYEEEEE